MARTRVVNCPTCGSPVAWNETFPLRPFCSERCKMIDLGAWATESYRIPVTDDKNQVEDAEPGEPPPRE